jgi:hypothetical protein
MIFLPALAPSSTKAVIKIKPIFFSEKGHVKRLFLLNKKIFYIPHLSGYGLEHEIVGERGTALA